MTLPTRRRDRSAGLVTGLRIECAVSEAASCAVKVAVSTRPDNIHRMATALPAVLIGALSPYPVVVIVTTAHQNPLNRPRRASGSNWPGLERRSNSQIAAPTISSSAIRRPSTDRKALEVRAVQMAESPGLRPLATATPSPDRKKAKEKSMTASRSAVMVMAAIEPLSRPETTSLIIPSSGVSCSL